MRTIDADALMDVIRQHEYRLATKNGSIDYGMFTLGIQQVVDEQPTVDVSHVRHGRWIDKGEYAVCTECGGRSGTQYDGVEPIPLTTQFCPNCGAKMDEVSE